MLLPCQYFGWDALDFLAFARINRYNIHSFKMDHYLLFNTQQSNKQFLENRIFSFHQQRHILFQLGSKFLLLCLMAQHYILKDFHQIVINFSISKGFYLKSVVDVNVVVDKPEEFRFMIRENWHQEHLCS